MASGSFVPVKGKRIECEGWTFVLVSRSFDEISKWRSQGNVSFFFECRVYVCVFDFYVN